MKLVMMQKQLQTNLIIFFTNVALDRVSQLPSASNTISVGSDFLLANFTVQKTPKITLPYIIEINEYFLFKDLKKLSLSKSTDLDGLPAGFI